MSFFLKVYLWKMDRNYAIVCYGLSSLHMQGLLTRLFLSFHIFFIPLSGPLFLCMHISLSNEFVMCAAQWQGSWLFCYLPPSSRAHWAVQTSSGPLVVNEQSDLFLMGFLEHACVALCLGGCKSVSSLFRMCSSLAVPQEGSVGLWACEPPAFLPSSQDGRFF